jgi:hypothetical protein
MNDETTKAYLAIPANKLKLWDRAKELDTQFRPKERNRYRCARDYIFPALCREIPELASLRPKKDLGALLSHQMQAVLMDRWALVDGYVDLDELYDQIEAENRGSRVAPPSSVKPLGNVKVPATVKAIPAPKETVVTNNGLVIKNWQLDDREIIRDFFEKYHECAWEAYLAAIMDFAHKEGLQLEIDLSSIAYFLCKQLAKNNGGWTVELN